MEAEGADAGGADELGLPGLNAGLDAGRDAAVAERAKRLQKAHAQSGAGGVKPEARFSDLNDAHLGAAAPTSYDLTSEARGNSLHQAPMQFAWAAPQQLGGFAFSPAGALPAERRPRASGPTGARQVPPPF